MRLLLTVVLSSVLWSAGAWAADKAEVMKAIDAAKAEFDKAVAEQGGWVSSKKLIRSAELSATKGNNDKALELAEQARREAQLSYQQAVSQQKHWSEPQYLKK
ncbi:MAG: SoxXA-binding protein [Gammaproteobacteria bacterium]